MLKASGFAPRVSVRVPVMSMGASARPSAPKKKNKQKTPWLALTGEAGVL